MTTVSSETVPPRPIKKRNKYFLVSSLRRAMKLMSCTSTRRPVRAPWMASCLTDTSKGPSRLLSRCPEGPEKLSSSSQRIVAGSVGVATASP